MEWQKSKKSHLGKVTFRATSVGLIEKIKEMIASFEATVSFYRSQAWDGSLGEDKPSLNTTVPRRLYCDFGGTPEALGEGYWIGLLENWGDAPPIEDFKHSITLQVEGDYYY